MPIFKARTVKKLKRKKRARIKDPKRVERPSKGGRFSFRKIPPSSQRLFKRVSEALGIPVTELMPSFGGLPKKAKWYKKQSGGDYDARAGKVRMLDDSSSTLNHEILHHLQELLSPLSFKERFREWGSDFPFFEKLTFKEKMRVLEKRKELVLEYNKDRKRRRFEEKQVKYCLDFLTNSPDYIILLLANPPRRIGPFSGMMWETKMEKAGYLDRKSRELTKKGLQLVRTRRQEIIDKLRYQGKTRDR